MIQRNRLSSRQHLVLNILGDAGTPLTTREVGQRFLVTQQKRYAKPPTAVVRQVLISLKKRQMVNSHSRENDVVWVLAEF